MKLIKSINELKKGDTIIVKDNADFYIRGFSRVLGDILTIEQTKLSLTIKCIETNSVESVMLGSGIIFLIS